jgi:hypothetical protein
MGTRVRGFGSRSCVTGMRMKGKPSVMMLASLILLAAQAVGHAQESPAAPSTLLFYDMYTGGGATGRISEDGQLEHVVQMGFSPSWSNIVNTHGGVIFFDSHSGLYAVARANPDGSMTTLSVNVLGGDFDFRYVVGTDNGVIFYDPWGVILIGQVASDGQLVFTQLLDQDPAWSHASWSHIIAFPGGRLFFYSEHWGAVAAGYISPDGLLVQTDSRADYVAEDFQKVVPVTDEHGDSILLYEGLYTGATTVVSLDAAGRVSRRLCAPVLQTGYSIVPSGRSLFFYRQDGSWAIGGIAGNDVRFPACRGTLRLQEVHGPGYLHAGYTHVESIDGRLLLYRQTDGTVLIAEIPPTGGLAVLAYYIGILPFYSSIHAVGDQPP